jgi:hypothetical protein
MNNFAAQASSIGQGIGGFLNPIIGGTTKTTTTETPIDKTSDNTITLAIVLVVVVVVGLFLFKSNKA